jgi:hypothetical protein
MEIVLAVVVAPPPGPAGVGARTAIGDDGAALATAR